MNDSPPASTRASVRRRSLLVLAAAAAALGLLTAVAADAPGAGLDVPRDVADDDDVYRRLVNEGQVPRAARDDVPDVTRRLVNEGLVPSGRLE